MRPPSAAGCLAFSLAISSESKDMAFNALDPSTWTPLSPEEASRARSAGGEETTYNHQFTPFSVNEKNEFYDPTFKRWLPQTGRGAYNMDFQRQVAANLANGNSAVWSSQTGWDQRSPIPPLPGGGNVGGGQQGGMLGQGAGVNPFQQQQPLPQGMSGHVNSINPFQPQQPQAQGMFGQGAGFNPFGSNQFFKSYWGK